MGIDRTVLVVDDQSGARQALVGELEDAGFNVIEAQDGLDAWERFCRDRPDLVITDMVMPRSDGLELLARIRERSDVPVIMFTAYGSVQSAVSALKSGADEFLSSSGGDADDLVGLARRVLTRSVSPAPSVDLAARLAGSSPAMTRIRTQIRGLAPLRAPVLVCGERGTGRNTVVCALHELGSTSGTDLRVVRPESDDVSIPPHVGAIYLESIERFRPPARAAWADRIARSERVVFAEGPRVFASVEYLPGSAVLRAVNPLAFALRRFRVDLPPLRDRAEDIPEIARAIIERTGRVIGRSRTRLSAGSLALLRTQPWPGNVGQLAEVLERAVAFARSGNVREEDVAFVIREIEDSVERIRARSSTREREELLAALDETGGNIARTAQLLGRTRSAVYRLIAKHGVRLRQGI